MSHFCFESSKTNLAEFQSQSNSGILIHINKVPKTPVEVNRHLLEFTNFNEQKERKTSKTSKLTKCPHSLTSSLSLGTQIIRGSQMITLSLSVSE